MGTPLRTVISASRRTDLPRCFPEWLAKVIRSGEVVVPGPFGGAVRAVSLRPEDVHTVVLWSKDYRPLLNDTGGLRRALERFDQVFCHFTITGLGGSGLEPSAPAWQDAAAQLTELVRLTGDPSRVSVRFDPIVHWVEGGHVCSNLACSEPIFDAIAAAGLSTVTSSFMSVYGKVRRRGWQWVEPTPADRDEIGARLVASARARGLRFLACCDPTLVAAGAEPTQCVDGSLLSRLHPQGLGADAGKDKGQRPHCGCTPSVDIGSYSQRCPDGCRYCYANPVVPRRTGNEIHAEHG